MGGKSITFKTDQENALNDLVHEIRELRKGSSTLIVNSAAYESPSNGVGERGVQSHEGQCRTIKLALEEHFEHRIPVAHPCVPWLVRHAAHLLCLFHVGSDGRTALERLMGKKYSGDLVEFGSGIHFRYPTIAKRAGVERCPRDGLMPFGLGNGSPPMSIYAALWMALLTIPILFGYVKISGT